MSTNWKREGSKLAYTDNYSLEQETSLEPTEWFSRGNNSRGKNNNNSISNNTKVPGKIYACNFCPRKFLNSQALGGHQNAHREEREEIKRLQNQMMMMAQLSMPYYYQAVYGSRTVQSLDVEPQTLAYHQQLSQHEASSSKEKEPYLNLDLGL